MRLGLVTTDTGMLGCPDLDIAPIRAALADAGAETDCPIWHDASVDWPSYDLLVIRSPWDYTKRLAEFTSWIHRTGALTRILNAPDLITWNMDKHYLSDLAKLGVRCIDSTYCRSHKEVAASLAALEHGRVVIKPTVSAGSLDTGLFMTGDPAALALADKILDDGKTVMVQPEIASVTASGESALFFFNMKYGYAFHKGPILVPGGGYVGGSYTETISAITPSNAEIQLGHDAIQAVATVAHWRGFSGDAQVPLYARIDIAITEFGGPQVIEVELFEPALNVNIVPEAIPAFVNAILRRLHGNGKG